MSDLYLLVGLGNPGKKYEHTRHNMGFDAIDLFADSLGIDIDKEGFRGLYIKCKYKDKDLILLKPQTFMNNSGFSVSDVVNYFKIDKQNLLVIYDDMDFEPGIIRLKERGSAGGHNGMKSIIEQLGTDEFKRLRIGIGRSKYNEIDHVLSKPSKEEQELIDKAFKRVVEAIKVYLSESYNKAMSIYNNDEVI